MTTVRNLGTSAAEEQHVIIPYDAIGRDLGYMAAAFNIVNSVTIHHQASLAHSSTLRWCAVLHPASPSCPLQHLSLILSWLLSTLPSLQVSPMLRLESKHPRLVTAYVFCWSMTYFWEHTVTQTWSERVHLNGHILWCIIHRHIWSVWKYKVIGIQNVPCKI